MELVRRGRTVRVPPGELARLAGGAAAPLAGYRNTAPTRRPCRWPARLPGGIPPDPRGPGVPRHDHLGVERPPCPAPEPRHRAQRHRAQRPSCPAPTRAPGCSARADLRNHRDYRPRRPRQKTTLVDAMLRQSGVFRRAMRARTSPTGSWTRWTWEREKGITILAKKHSGPPRRHDHQHHRHPRPRRLRRRGSSAVLAMVDGVLLLVGRERGPAAADPVRAAQGARRPAACDPRHQQQGRPFRRPGSPRSSTRPTSCSSTLDADEEQIDFPIIYCNAKAGRASTTRPADGDSPDSPDLKPLFDLMMETIPAPTYNRGPRRCRRWSRTWTPRRTWAGSRCAGCTTGRSAAASRRCSAARDGTQERVKVSELLMTDAPRAHPPAEDAGPRRHHPPSPASRTSPSARRWRTRRSAARCPSSPSTRPSISMTVGVEHLAAGG